MANVTKTIGRVPVWRGQYAQGTTYYKDNIVEMYGSAYISTVDNNTSAPASVDEERNITVNEGWEVFTDASAAYKYGEDIGEILNLVGDINSILDEINGEEA